MRSRKMKRSKKTKQKEPWLTAPKALVISSIVTAIVEIIKIFKD